MQVQSLGWEDLLQEELATHSSILAWEIPQTEESGGLYSMGLRRVRHEINLCKWTYLQNRNRLTCLKNKLMVAGAGRIGGRDSQEVWDGHVHTALFKMETNKDLPYSTGNCAQWNSLDGRGVWERMDTCICMDKCLCCLSETIITLLTGCCCCCC